VNGYIWSEGRSYDPDDPRGWAYWRCPYQDCANSTVYEVPGTGVPQCDTCGRELARRTRWYCSFRDCPNREAYEVLGTSMPQCETCGRELSWHPDQALWPHER
jgi:ribosomal protein S27E